MKSDYVHDVLEKVATLSGNSKQQYLKTVDPGICKYILAAYDPFTRYYITKGCKGEGDLQFDESTWLLLEKLSTRELSGLDAVMTVNTVTQGMTLESADLFQRILKKDLRISMGAKTLNKVYPGLIPTHDIMLAKLFDVNRLKFPCFGSPKIDGVRAKFKNGKFYSRKGIEYVGLDHITKEIKNINEELDGELIVPNTTFQQSSGLIRNDSPTPDAEFHIFEIPTLEVPFTERLIVIQDINYVTDSHIQVVHHEKLNDKDHVMNYYDVCRGLGYEGTVIKPWDYQYKGTRSYDWMKMKPVETVDLKVVELFEGKGKYKSQMGGVIVNYKGKPNKVGGGFSDKQRKDFWIDPDLIIGKTIEVFFMEETDDGNLRHARFIGIRGDK